MGKRVRVPALASILVVGAVWAVTLGLLEKRAFWITDNANKFLQLEALVSHSYADSSIPWPGRSIDPGLTANPLPPPFSHVHDGELYSQYSPVFAALSSIPFRGLGFAGLYLLPWIGALAALAAVARIARALAPGSALAPHLAVLLTGLCTPVWFYSVVFWEHTPALALVLWALVAVLRFEEDGSMRTLAGASALAAASVYLRDDLVLLSVALAGMAIASRPRRWLRILVAWGAVAFVTLVPLAVFHWITTGDALGFHVRSNVGGLADHLASRPLVAWRLFVASHPNAAASVALGAPFLVALVWRPRLAESRFRVALPVAAAVAFVAGGIGLAGLWTTDRPVQWLIESNSFFPAAPLILVGLIGLRRAGAGDAADRILRVVLAYVLAYAVLAPEIASVGIHWGNRFLLAVYPLLTVVAAARIAAWLALRPSHVARGALAGVVVLSLAAQLTSLRLLALKKDFTHRLNREVASREATVVVTDTWWAAQEMFSEFYRRPMFLVTSEHRLVTLQHTLKAHGYDVFLFVTPDPETMKNPNATVVDDGGLGYFSLALLPVRIR